MRDKGNVKAGTATLKQQFNQAMSKIAATQCRVGEDGHARSTDGTRIATEQWPVLSRETDMNPEGGFCSMPTQFLGTLQVGNLHRRHPEVDGHHAEQRVRAMQAPSVDGVDMYLPWELMQERLLAYPLPVSPALQRFRDIAWDGVDSVDKENRLCEGSYGSSDGGSSDNNGANLRNYDWATPFCDQGVVFNSRGLSRLTEAIGATTAATKSRRLPLSADAVLAAARTLTAGGSGGSACCAAACGSCSRDGGACSGRGGGAGECCPETIVQSSREFTSSWDVVCDVPKACVRWWGAMAQTTSSSERVAVAKVADAATLEAQKQGVPNVGMRVVAA
jgi:hypothetical protein